MEAESYQKTGRGGAGNFYSKHDIEEATKHTAQSDLEAQSQATGAPIESSETSQSGYTISGRGGAGNYWSKEDNAGANLSSPSSSSDPPLSINPSIIPKMGYSGRGGIGNIRSGEVEKLREDMELNAAEARQRAHEEVVRDVEMGLKMPERAHLGAEKLE